MPERALLIPTTHWDRAWYWPAERFRIKLIELFQAAKEIWASDAQWRFHLDGQSVALHDYLAAVPEDRALLTALGAAGRFTCGPWYVQPDLYCTGGEATIRNLLIGTADAAEFGASTRVLYLPDTFGLTPEIPQIADGFGLAGVAFMRGTAGIPGFPQEHRLLRWSGPDGTTVRVVRLRDGYANAAALGLHKGTGEVHTASGIRPVFDLAKAVEKLREAVARQRDGQGGPHVLLAGVDHQIPQRELPAILAALGDADIAYGDWNDAADELLARDASAWHEHRGEFHADGNHSVLGGTLSTRVWLKQRNAAVERALVQVAEPAEALCALLGTADAAGRVIALAWRRLLLVHPHDDITGCSVDAVHQEDAQHLTSAAQAADAVRRRFVHLLVQRHGGQEPGDARDAFCAVDTSGRAGPRRVRLRLDFEGRLDWGDRQPPAAYDVVDESGRALPFRELWRGASIEHPHQALDLEIQADLAPFAFRRFFLAPRRTFGHAAAERVLANDRLRAVVRDDGSVDLTDLRTGRALTGIGRLWRQADAGDEYDYSHAAGDAEEPLAPRLRRVPAAGCAGMQVVRMAGDGVTVTWSLAPGEAWLSLDVAIDDAGPDVRLRLGLDLPAAPRATRAGLKWTEVERPCLPGHEHPADHHVAVDGAGLALFCPHPFAYEAVLGERPRLAATLLRAVGFLGRGDLLTRPGFPGPPTPTPAAQCRGPQAWRFAIRPFADDERGGLFAEAASWRQEAVTGLIHGYDPALVDTPAPAVAVVSGPAVVQACKRSHDRTRTVIRLMNPTATPCRAVLAVAGATALTPVGLDERPRGAAIAASDGRFTVELPPWGLATLACGG